MLATITFKSPDGRRHSAWSALVAVSCAAAIGACGSAGPNSAAGTGSGDSLALEFAGCMRSHGVPNFPDPGKPVGGPGSGINEQAPAFQAAEQKCDKLTNNPQPKGSPLPQSQRLAALAFSNCMRKHGLANFPDPTFPSTGGVEMQAGPGPGEAQSPAFKQAQAACGRRP
jgi:hypothetical protein